ncbi:MAG: HEAT repeat domain-containing protein [Planctomycetota bacterium]
MPTRSNRYRFLRPRLNRPMDLILPLAMLALAMTAASWMGCAKSESKLPDSIKAKVREFQLERQAAEAEHPSGQPRTSLGSSGPARAGVPAEAGSRFLVRPYDDWTMGEASAMALSRIGSASVPALREALQSAEPSMRSRAADTLAKIGPDAADAVPDLIVNLNDPDLRVRKSAARALGQIGPKAAPAVPTLMKAITE